MSAPLLAVGDGALGFWNAIRNVYPETKDEALKLRKNFESHFELKQERAVTCIKKEWDQFMSFYDFPAVNWTSIRTTNPIESSFATVKLRTK